jgi:hypothetical protein
MTLAFGVGDGLVAEALGFGDGLVLRRGTPPARPQVEDTGGQQPAPDRDRTEFPKDREC